MHRNLEENKLKRQVLSIFSVLLRWEQGVDIENALYLGAKPKVAARDEAATQKLRWVELMSWSPTPFVNEANYKNGSTKKSSMASCRYVPPTWTYECDEDLVHYFYEHIGKEDENLGSVKQCVTSIDVSSCSVSWGPHSLMKYAVILCVCWLLLEHCQSLKESKSSRSILQKCMTSLREFPVRFTELLKHRPYTVVSWPYIDHTVTIIASNIDSIMFPLLGGSQWWSQLSNRWGQWDILGEWWHAGPALDPSTHEERHCGQVSPFIRKSMQWYSA